MRAFLLKNTSNGWMVGVNAFFQGSYTKVFSFTMFINMIKNTGINFLKLFYQLSSSTERRFDNLLSK